MDVSHGIRELESSRAIRDRLGGVGRAFAVLRRVTGDERWQQLAEERRRDLLVYLALANFGGSLSFSQLAPELQFDVKDLFGSYKTAVGEADKLLYAAGNTAVVDECSSRVTRGKRTQEALCTVRASALPRVPAVLRVYEGCGRALTGTVDEGNIIKLQPAKTPGLVHLVPRSDADPHPALTTVVIARLGELDVTFLATSAYSANPPILHRKETFVAEDYPERLEFERLTAQEEKAGILNLATIKGHAGRLVGGLSLGKGHHTGQYGLVRSWYPRPNPRVDDEF